MPTDTELINWLEKNGLSLVHSVMINPPKQYVYKITGTSLTGEKDANSWDRKERNFSHLVLGKNIMEVIAKTEYREFKEAITESVYHNDVLSFPITEVKIEIAELITEVEVY